MATFTFTAVGQWIAIGVAIQDEQVDFIPDVGSTFTLQRANIINSIDFTADVTSGTSFLSNCDIDVSKLPIQNGYITKANMSYNGFQKMREDIIDPVANLVAQGIDGKQMLFDYTQTAQAFTFNTNTTLLSSLQVDTNFLPYVESVDGDETTFTKTQTLNLINELKVYNRALVIQLTAGTGGEVYFPTLNSKEIVANF